jgi:uncharacterized protein (DUF1919 family)
MTRLNLYARISNLISYLSTSVAISEKSRSIYICEIYKIGAGGDIIIKNWRSETYAHY